MENSTMKTGNPVANEEDFQKVANKVSTITIIGNIALSLLKLFAGIVAHSNAMISDAIHSASDVFSTFIVIIGIRLASKKPDKEHPYGHERLECVAAIVLAIVLLITGLGIGIEAFKTILQGNSDNIQTPGILALIAAIISIASKEAMYWYTRYHAKRIDSSALMADAWHHRSDAFSSIGALRNPNVHKIDVLRTRIFGNKIYVDVEIALDGSITLQDAHDVAEKVHNDIEKTFPKVKHIMVHVNPAKL